MTTTDLVTEPATPNGVAIDAIREARQAMTDLPELASFTWRAGNRWTDGTHCRTTFDDFYGAGAEQAHRRPMHGDSDHPELFAAADTGPTPVEWLLHALAGCLTAGIATVAANRGIALTEVTSRVEGDMDMRGVLGIDPDVRNGYTRIRIRFTVTGDADPARLRRIVEQSVARSAVYDVLTRGTDVQVLVED